MLSLPPLAVMEMKLLCHRKSSSSLCHKLTKQAGGPRCPEEPLKSGNSRLEFEVKLQITCSDSQLSDAQ